MNPNVVAATLEGGGLDFHIIQILHAEQKDFSTYVSSNDNRIILTRQWFVWPESLLPNEPGQFVLAFFREVKLAERPTGWEGPPYTLLDVIPTSKRLFPSDQSLSDIRDLIRTELLNQLKAEKSATRQLALLRFAYPLMDRRDVEIIQAFLQHSEMEHQKTARALLLALTRDPKYIPALEKDLEIIMELPHKSLDLVLQGLCSGLRDDGLCDYGYLTWFDSAKGHEFPSISERKERAALRPLFRWVINNATDSTMRWELGIKPLVSFGTEEDYPLLNSISSEVGENTRYFSDALYYLKHGHMPPESVVTGMEILSETASTLNIAGSYKYVGDQGETGIFVGCHVQTYGRDHPIETHAASFAPAMTGKHTAQLQLQIGTEEKAPFDSQTLCCNFTKYGVVYTGGWCIEYKKTWSR